MFNPEKKDDRSYDGYVVKVWNKEFRARQSEIELQEEAFIGSGIYKVPRIICVDPAERGFVMDRVTGETAYSLFFKNPKRMSESMRDVILDGFQDLNAKGIVHADAHTMNYMLAEPEFGMSNASNIILDAELWIIDFGRSIHSASDADIIRISRDLAAKVVPDTDA
jgi:tRNA A-37 threonylcarbamoyl transferase component Bud32